MSPKVQRPNTQDPKTGKDMLESAVGYVTRNPFTVGTLTLAGLVGLWAVHQASTNMNSDAENNAKAENLTTNPNYRICIAQKNGGGTIKVYGNAPQEFDMAHANQYTDLLSVLGGSATNNAMSQSAGKAARIAGLSAFGRLGLIQIWEGTQPLDFRISLVYKAHHDPVKELILPITNLLTIFAPKKLNKIMLVAPGPFPLETLRNSMAGIADSTFSQNLSSLVNSFTGGGGSQTNASGRDFLDTDRTISISIGQNVLIKGMIPVSMNWKWGSRSTKDGLPISVEANLEFKSYTVYTGEDYKEAFFKGGKLPASRNTTPPLSDFLNDAYQTP
jgi:hypothetical protein